MILGSISLNIKILKIIKLIVLKNIFLNYYYKKEAETIIL